MRFLPLLLFQVVVSHAYSSQWRPTTQNALVHSERNISGSRNRAQFTPLPSSTLKRDAVHRRNTMELRAGASLAIPGLDPVNIFFSQNPFAAAFIVCALKASTADIVAQKAASVAASIKDIDVRRNAAFLVYGGAYQGIFQEFLFNRIFPLLFGDDVGLTTVLKKVMVDMFIVSPFLCLPVAYIIKALAFKQSAMDGVKRYIGDVKNSGLLIKYWKVWAPVQTMTFTIVPAKFRITFIACFSFFWLIVLSAISSKND